MLPSISPFLGFVMHTANSTDTRARTSAHKQTIRLLCRSVRVCQTRVLLQRGEMVMAECERGKDTATHCGRTCVSVHNQLTIFLPVFIWLEFVIWFLHRTHDTVAHVSLRAQCLHSIAIPDLLLTFDATISANTRIYERECTISQRRCWRQVASNDVWEPFFLHFVNDFHNRRSHSQRIRYGFWF